MNTDESEIAIIGMGCRFPGGVSSSGELWDLLLEKKDAIIDIPKDRWDKRQFCNLKENIAGKMYAMQGGFLTDDIYSFDPLFFGISPREANSLDPQQRLLLETTYEAIEDSGLQLEKLKGSKTGVFIGGFTLDNYLLQLGKDHRMLIDSHTATSSTLTMLSNRLSYVFDFKGPSLTLDTACSSSLVALHYACLSIINNESDLCVCGGVNIMLKPEFSTVLSKGKFNSIDNRCKTFDKDANGYVRGEGCGIVILKPLSKAKEDKNIILATIKGTAVNQDGYTNGITVPNMDSQIQLINELYKKNNIDRDKIHYIEAHGTGTSVGDPIEIEALDLAIGSKQVSGNKCYVGSIKTNIGHLEAASGVAAVIKSVLCLQNKTIPPNLHFNNPNPKIDFNKIKFKVPTEEVNMPVKETSYVAINSFGYGGTNAHVVLGEYKNSKKKQKNDKRNFSTNILPISARDDKALKEIAKSYLDSIENKGLDVEDLLYSAINNRSHHKQRLALVAEKKEEIAIQLKNYCSGHYSKQILQNNSECESNHKIVFVYTGMGPQWWKMGREMIAKVPLFKETIEECDQIFTKIAGWSILKELLAGEKESRMLETQVAQPANFVIQIALTKVLNHYGIYPDAVIGHSVGEVSASYVSNALSMEDALLVSYHRSRLQQTTAGSGKMLAVGLPENEVIELLPNYNCIDIAAVNSPSSVTLAGNEGDLLMFSKYCNENSIFNRMLNVEVPYHSYLMDPLKEELIEVLGSLKPKDATIDLYSTVYGEKIEGKKVGADYWWKNVRNPVLFAKTIQNIEGSNFLFIEVGPHPVLRTNIAECFKSSAKSTHTIETLNKKEPEFINFYSCLGNLYTFGIPIHWEKLINSGEYIKLPQYLWQKQKYWNESEESINDRLGQNDNVFFNKKVDSLSPMWKVELNNKFFPFLYDHIVQNHVVFPGAGYICAGLELNKKVFGIDSCMLFGAQFKRILPIKEDAVQDFYISFDNIKNAYKIYSKDVKENQYNTHFSSNIKPVPSNNDTSKLNIAEIVERCSIQISHNDFYERLFNSGLEYLSWFRCVQEIHKNENESIAKILFDPQIKEDYLLHPVILDACFQTAIIFSDEKKFLPVSIESIYFKAKPGKISYCYTNLVHISDSYVLVDLKLLNEEGDTLGEVYHLKCEEIVKQDDQASNSINNWFYNYKWEESQLPVYDGFNTTKGETWLVFNQEKSSIEPFLQLCSENNIDCFTINNNKKYKSTDKSIDVNFYEKGDFLKLFSELKDRTIYKILYITPINNENFITEVNMEESIKNLIPIVYLVQAMEHFKFKGNTHLNIVTRNANHLKNDSTVNLSVSSLLGIGILVGKEHPNLIPKIIDFNSPLTRQYQDILFAESVMANADEDVAYRNGKRYIKKLNYFDKNELGLEKEVVFTENPMQAVANGNKLFFKDINTGEINENEIEIETTNVKIFSNNNLQRSIEILGEIKEYHGKIKKIGEKVTGFKEGDEVIAVDDGDSIKSILNIDCKCLIKKTESVKEYGFQFFPYLIAFYIHKNLLNIKKEDSILIHNAGSNIGLALIHLAKYMGVHIYATTNNDQDKQYVKRVGVKEVVNINEENFNYKIGKKLNSGYIDAIIADGQYEIQSLGLQLISPFGKLVNFSLASTLNTNVNIFGNITINNVDVEQLIKNNMPMLLGNIPEINSAFEEGCIYMLPEKKISWSNLSKSSKANESTHKIIDINVTQETVKYEYVEKNLIFNPDATYIITGGTRGLGLEISNWLFQKGARNMVLISKSGLQIPEAKETVSKLKENGANVLVYATDISDGKKVNEIFKKIAVELPPIAGIFHAAMVLDDGYLMDMDEERFRKVMLPKVKGVINLHESTKNMLLDFFISFSSISTIIGNKGQANYIAANSFLDSFSFYRRANNLPATTINLGVLSEIGVVARSSDTQRILKSYGISGIATREVLKALEIIINNNPTQIGFFDVDWDKLLKNSSNKVTSRFSFLVSKELLKGSAGNSLQDELNDLSESEKQNLISNLLTKKVSEVLKIPEEKIDKNTGLNYIGLDSIVTAELIGILNNELGISISPVDILAGPSIKQLSKIILEMK